MSARALEVSPRTVRRFIERGELEGRKVKEGITETWEVSIDSLHALRAKREAQGQVRRESADESAATDTIADVLRDLTVRLEQRAASEADLRARLELTAQAESTLREQLEEERERAYQERERVLRLEEELRDARRPWWQRWFGE